jgi:hypothetical protein
LWKCFIFQDSLLDFLSHIFLLLYTILDTILGRNQANAPALRFGLVRGWEHPKLGWEGFLIESGAVVDILDFEEALEGDAYYDTYVILLSSRASYYFSVMS